MGPILAILSYVTKTFSNLLLVKNKTTSSSYDANKHSNEAIGNDTDTILSNQNVAGTNTVENALARDAIGNKADTPNPYTSSTSSIMSYVKGLISLHQVPNTDNTDNVYLKDVIGSKYDTPQTTVTSYRSMMAYVKGLTYTGLPVINSIPPMLSSPYQDSTNNTTVADVVGNKADSEATNVANTTSAIAYLKGLIQELDQRKVPKMVCVAPIWDGNWYDVVNITDKGVLICIRQEASGSYLSGCGHLKITIDDIVIYDSTSGEYPTQRFVETKFLDAENYYRGHNSILFHHRFNTSLLIQHIKYNVANLRTWVTYTTDD